MLTATRSLYSDRDGYLTPESEIILRRREMIFQKYIFLLIGIFRHSIVCEGNGPLTFVSSRRLMSCIIIYMIVDN